MTAEKHHAVMVNLCLALMSRLRHAFELAGHSDFARQIEELDTRFRERKEK